MTVQELITELQKHDPEMEVQIQQGYELFEYVFCHTVTTKELIDGEAWSPEIDDEIEPETYVVIQYE